MKDDGMEEQLFLETAMSGVLGLDGLGEGDLAHVAAIRNGD